MAYSGFLITGIIYVCLYLFIRYTVSDTTAFIEQIKEFYKDYGYFLVFFGAVLEGTFLLGLYIPGSTVVLLGAALSRSGVVAFPLVYVLGTTGLLVGYCFNYLCGRFGWYHLLKKLGFEKGIIMAQHKIEKYGMRAILAGYFFPGSASFLSTACGTLKVPFLYFLGMSIIAQGFWSLWWGGLAYVFGLTLVEFMMKYFGLVVMGGLVLWFVKRNFKKK